MPPVLSEPRRHYPGQATGCRHCDTAKEAQSQRVCDSGHPTVPAIETAARRLHVDFSTSGGSARIGRRTEQRGPAPLALPPAHGHEREPFRSCRDLDEPLFSRSAGEKRVEPAALCFSAAISVHPDHRDQVSLYCRAISMSNRVSPVTVASMPPIQPPKGASEPGCGNLYPALLNNRRVTPPGAPSSL